MRCAPFETTAIHATPSRAAWDAEAPELVATMLRRWRLTALHPFAAGAAGSVLAVRTEHGDDAVLKVGYPHVEGVWEAVGLDALGPRLAPAVLRQDAWTWSLPLQRIHPGTPLNAAPMSTDAALATAARLLSRIGSADTAVPSLADTMRPFVDLAERSPLGPRPDLVLDGLAAYRELLDSPAPVCFVHGDLNPGNLLADGRGWRVVDPKPMRGDPAFDLPPLLDQLDDPWSAGVSTGESTGRQEALPRRLLRAATLAGLDPSRAARWAFARAALDVSWYLQADDPDAVALSLRRAAGWREIASSL